MNKSYLKYVNEFTEYLKISKGFSEHTVKSYLTDLNQFGSFLLKTFNDLSKETEDKKFVINFDELDINILKSFIAGFTEKEAIQDNVTYCNKSISRKISTIKSFYKFLSKRKYILNNYSSLLIFPKLEKRLPDILNKKEIADLLDNKLNDEKEILDKAIIELFYSTGIRESELIELKLKDININNRTLKVLGKGSKQRIIPFGKSAEEAIKKYLILRKSLNINNIENLFVLQNGKKLYPMKVYRILNNALSKVTEMKKKSPHILRHSYATHLIDNGADISFVKDLLGHESLSTTQVYTQVSAEKLRKVYNKAHPEADVNN